LKLGQQGENLSRSKIMLPTALAMLAFAGNSILCRLALKTTTIDPASFTTVRMVSAAAMLALILRWRGVDPRSGGNWKSAAALFAYAAGFSLAYVNLTAATGALLLFGSVQISMISISLWRGERMSMPQIAGFAVALAGLVVLVFPGLAAPPIASSALMIGAGVAWGVYSLRGRGAGDPTAVTAGNFIRTIPMTFAFSLIAMSQFSPDRLGFVYAVLSGAVTSGIGYAIWYFALPKLRFMEAAIVQLSVPIIAAIGGVMLLGETLTVRLFLAALAVLGGILLVTVEKTRAAATLSVKVTEKNPL
jgi:drug/metabolite transporter (DMT)-like permease